MVGGLYQPAKKSLGNKILYFGYPDDGLVELIWAFLFKGFLCIVMYVRATKARHAQRRNTLTGKHGQLTLELSENQE
jgi:hypothetical protein